MHVLGLELNKQRLLLLTTSIGHRAAARHNPPGTAHKPSPDPSRPVLDTLRCDVCFVRHTAIPGSRVL